MELNDLRVKLKNKELSNFYIFSGTESEIMNLYIKQFQSIKNFLIVKGDFISEYYGEITSSSLFNQPTIYYIYEDKLILKKPEYINNILNTSTENILILRYSKIDQRLKFFKDFSDYIVYFNQLSIEVLRKYAVQWLGKKNINIEELDKLISYCNFDFNLLKLEIEKIILMDNFNLSKILEDSSFISKGIENKPFDLINAILDNDSIDIRVLYNQFIQSNGDPLLLISLLCKSLVNVIKISNLNVSSKDYSNLKKDYNINYYDFETALKLKPYFSYKKLINLFIELRYVENKIKTGLWDKFLAFEYILMLMDF